LSVEEKVAVQVDGRTLTLTNLAKVLYPRTGFTKAEVLSYYQQVAPVLLPHITGRPLTLKRYPDGVDGQAFFAKHAPQHRPDWVRTATIVSTSSRARGERVTYLVVDDLPALIWVANLAGLELHAPMWRLPRGGPVPDGPERAPDLLVFDLDPGLPATIVECCRVALGLRPLLVADGLDPLPKSSGGKGLQLYARIGGLSAEQASDLAKSYAERLERENPKLVVSRMTKALRAGRVFIDWSQNNGKKTTIAPYSLRARERPTVSTPVTWDEVASCAAPADLTFTAEDLPARIATHGDLFAPLLPTHPLTSASRRFRLCTVLALLPASPLSSVPSPSVPRADRLGPAPLRRAPSVLAPDMYLLASRSASTEEILDTEGCDHGRHDPRSFRSRQPVSANPEMSGAGRGGRAGRGGSGERARAGRAQSPWRGVLIRNRA
jgi:bifunctional non-homologous end joining protein LigD